MSLDFRSRGQVIRNFVLSVLLVVGFVATTFWLAWPSLRPVFVALPVFAAYCAIAYFLRVRPNHDQLGLGGGIVDNPLRWSDGANRGLIQLAVVLALGRYISLGLVDGIRLFSRAQLPHDQLMQNIEREDARSSSVDRT